MVKCSLAQSSSQKALDACARSAYFKYQQEFFSDHYHVYDSGVEGIRNTCWKKGKKCHFHELIENTKQLAADGWRDLPVERVNTPVPDYDEKSPNFHYCFPQQIESGNFKEKFSLKKVKIMAQKRELNDYCPGVQLQKLIDDCWKPELSYDPITHEDGNATVTPVDNETMKKAHDKVDHFVDEFVGKDLRDEVVCEAEKQVELKIKTQMKINQRKESKNVAAAKHVDDFDWNDLQYLVA